MKIIKLPLFTAINLLFAFSMYKCYSVLNNDWKFIFAYLTGGFAMGIGLSVWDRIFSNKRIKEMYCANSAFMLGMEVVRAGDRVELVINRENRKVEEVHLNCEIMGKELANASTKDIIQKNSRLMEKSKTV